MQAARIDLGYPGFMHVGGIRLDCVWTPAAALAGLLLCGFAVRAFVAWTQLYVIAPDDTFQYLEQAHRLAFGSGVVPWEYLDGARSWLLPGILAGLMRAAALIGPGPDIYLRVIRLTAVLASLGVVVVGFRLVLRRDGLPGAILTGVLCAFWAELVFFSPAMLTEVFAGNCALLGILCGDIGSEDSVADTAVARRLAIAGIWFGLAVSLRFQYAPAVLAAAAWQHRLAWHRWTWLAAGGLAVMVPVGGLLDLMTWGAPFQSLWLNLARNGWQGVGDAFGIGPWDLYLDYLLLTLQPAAPVLIVLAVVGAIRLPAVALAAVVTVLLHSLVPHKEYRFVYLAVAASPILIGAGASALLGQIRLRAGRTAAIVALSVVGLLGAADCGAAAMQSAATGRWALDRAALEAFLAAHRAPGICGLGVTGVQRYLTGGYAYLDRSVPLYFDDFTSSVQPPGVLVALRAKVVLAGRTLAEPSPGTLALEQRRFNYLIAPPGRGFDGFAPASCFAADGVQLCLFRREGDCQD